MAILTDTNILLRFLQPHHPHCLIAQRAIDVLRTRNEVLNIAAQNLIELWAVATRSLDQNGLGFTIEQAANEMDRIKRLWVLLFASPLIEQGERLVKVHRVSGKNTHDAHLVAAMLVHGVDTILTFNTKDFARYTGITAIHPASVV